MLLCLFAFRRFHTYTNDKGTNGMRTIDTDTNDTATDGTGINDTGTNVACTNKLFRVFCGQGVIYYSKLLYLFIN